MEVIRAECSGIVFFDVKDANVEPVLGPKAHFSGPFVCVGTPSNNTVGDHAGLPVVATNTRNRA